MNNRDYKIFRVGQYYHIFNRGNNKEPIITDDYDARNFLHRLRITLNLPKDPSFKIRTSIKPLPKDAFTIMSYCLMPNHYHLQIRQNSDIPISALLKNWTTSYSKYFNQRHGRVGNLFQDTFKAKLVSSDHYLLYLSAYIHNNPESALTYPFSSLHEYADPKNYTNISNPTELLRQFNNNPELYMQFVESFNYQSYKKIQHLTFED